MPSMTGYNQGAIVLLPFPFSDQSATKIRPAVVASPIYPSDDLLVVAVTSVGGSLRPGEFAIQWWREAGLLHPSFVKRAVTSVASGLIKRQLGDLDPMDLQPLNRALYLWFGL